MRLIDFRREDKGGFVYFVNICVRNNRGVDVKGDVIVEVRSEKFVLELDLFFIRCIYISLFRISEPSFDDFSVEFIEILDI